MGCLQSGMGSLGPGKPLAHRVVAPAAYNFSCRCVVVRSLISPRHAGQLMVQIVAILRNLSLSKRHLQPFWLTDVVSAMMSSCSKLIRHSELMINVARLLG